MKSSNTLNEICKVSAIKATAALSKFLHTPVVIELNPVEVKHIDEIHLSIKNEESIVALTLPITNNIQGSSFFIYTEKAALSLCDELLHKPEGTTTAFHTQEISALAETSNIVIGTFLTSLANSLQIDRMLHRPATFKKGTFQELFGAILTTLEKKMEEVVVKISFGFRHVNIQGCVLILFEHGKIISALNKTILSGSNL